MLTIEQAAKLLRVSERTLHNWEAGRVRIPYAAYKLIRILRGYELPGDAWQGYRLIGDTLWSPENLPFKAADARWWSLTVRMAHAYSESRRELLQIRHSARQSEKLSSVGAAVPALGFISSKTSFSSFLKSDPKTTPKQQNQTLNPSPTPNPWPIIRLDVSTMAPYWPHGNHPFWIQNPQTDSKAVTP